MKGLKGDVMLNNILLILSSIIIIFVIGYFNYKNALNRGKSLYCNINRKNIKRCDFLEKNKGL